MLQSVSVPYYASSGTGAVPRPSAWNGSVHTISSSILFLLWGVRTRRLTYVVELVWLDLTQLLVTLCGYLSPQSIRNSEVTLVLIRILDRQTIDKISNSNVTVLTGGVYHRGWWLG